MPNNTTSNKRIAKNTMLLYIRTFFVMLISLYTSRVVLKALGVEDYGVYNVVGGIVAMFSVISGALSTTISRFITYEIGSGDSIRLKKVFSTSLAVQIVIAAIIVVLVEIIGVWFLKTQMQIPEGRETAAMWVLQCSLVAFCIDLISLPYNACIIAHEHMGAFAYISILQAVLKLVICFLLLISPIDRLILYALLMLVVSIIIRVIYTIYCHRHFEESSVRIHYYKDIFKEMFGFAGWSFFTNSIYIINTQGVNMLINVYYGVVYNAARGVANQVEHAVISFVNSFTTAINPQITKSYAAGALDDMFTLVCRGARFSYYLMLMMALPIICETEMILRLWLTEVPDKAAVFIQLSLFNGLLDSVGNTSYTANVATGKIKAYSIVVSIITVLVFPITWIVYFVGGAVESPYLIYFVLRIFVLIARMFFMQKLIGFSIKKFIKQVYAPVIMTTILAVIPSILIMIFMPCSYIRLAISLIVGVTMVGIVSFYVGMTKGERTVIMNKVGNVFNRIKEN